MKPRAASLLRPIPFLYSLFPLIPNPVARHMIPVWVMCRPAAFWQHAGMTTDLLSTFSNQLADVVAAAAPSVVQVQGRRRPASGLVYADDVVLTTVRTLGREDGLHVRRDVGRTLDAELAGLDPTTSLAVLRVAGLDIRPIAPSASSPRVGHLAL